MWLSLVQCPNLARGHLLSVLALMLVCGNFQRGPEVHLIIVTIFFLTLTVEEGISSKITGTVVFFTYTCSILSIATNWPVINWMALAYKIHCPFENN